MSTFLARIALVAIIFFALHANAQSFVPGEVIVKMKANAASSGTAKNFAARMRSSHGYNVKNHFAALRMYHMALPAGKSVEGAIAELKQDGDVEYAEPNYILTKASVSGVQRRFTAEQIQQQQNSAQSTSVMVTGANIGLSQVYAQATSGYVGNLALRPIIAVIDTGIDTTHYVFKNTKAVWTNPGEIAANGIDDDGNGYIDDVHGWNFVSNSGNMYDDDGHGTHVSGIILSIDQNYFSNPMVTSKIQIMPLKFLDATGSGSTANAIKAVYYAVQNGASVMNNSWGGSSYSTALNEAIAYSYTAGATFVAAAGNGNNGVGYDTDSAPMYPASYDVPNIVSVAAITDTDGLASFSNFGPNTVHLGSPGVYILSTLPGNSYGEMSGTSMATPFVAGTAIQMKVYSPDMLGHQVKSILMGQATTVSGLQNKVASQGKLATANSINAASSASVDTTQPAYTITYQPDRSLASSLAGGGCGLVTKMNGGDGGPGEGLGGIGVMAVLIMLPLAYLVYRRVQNPANRRRYDRFNIHSDVRIQVGDRELVGSVSSISLGGARVDTNALLQDGGLVTLSIASPDGKESIEVQGRVVWSEANKSYGVAFADASQGVLSSITNWTKALQRAS
jgi:hypothetical protein